MEDRFALFVAWPILFALMLGWIEIGPVGSVLLIGLGMVWAVAHIACGLLAAVADLLAGRRD